MGIIMQSLKKLLTLCLSVARTRSSQKHMRLSPKDEPTDHGSEPEVTSYHVATGVIEETTTSSAFADLEDVVEGMGNLFS